MIHWITHTWYRPYRLYRPSATQQKVNMRAVEVRTSSFVSFMIPEASFAFFISRHVWTWQVLLATLSDNVVVSKQTGKVRDKDRTWDSVKKSLLGNINGFLEELKVAL